MRLDFVTNNLVRIYLTTEVSANARTKSVEILEFDVPGRRLSHSGAFEGIGLTIGPDHDRLITRIIDLGYRARQHYVLDARTGAQLANLGQLGEGEGGQAWLTSRGSVELVSGGGKARAELHGPDGKVTRVIDLGPAHDLLGAGEPAPGKMAVALYSSFNATPGDLVLIDLDNGSVRKVASGLIPVYRTWTGTFPRPGSIATKLYEESRGKLIYFDPLTGDRHDLAGR